MKKQVLILLAMLSLGLQAWSQVVYFFNNELINNVYDYYAKNNLEEKFGISSINVYNKLDSCYYAIKIWEEQNDAESMKFIEDFNNEFLQAVLNDKKTEIKITTRKFIEVCDKYILKYQNWYNNHSQSKEHHSHTGSSRVSSTYDVVPPKDYEASSERYNFSSWIEITISLIVLLLIAGCFAGCFCSIRTLKRKVKDVENRLSELKSNDKMSQQGNVQDRGRLKSSDPRSQATSHINVSKASEKQPEKTSPVETQKALERKPNEPISNAGENKNEETNAGNHSLEKIQEAQPEKSQEVTSSTKTIYYIKKTSETETKFKVINNRNKDEVFQLSVDSPEATNGEISLTEKYWDDTFRGRVISNRSTYLSSNFCDVVPNAENPKNIIVTETGRARKIGEKEWEVISKLKITLE